MIGIGCLLIIFIVGYFFDCLGCKGIMLIGMVV